MSTNEKTPLGGNREASTTRTGDTRMVTTAESLTQSLRQKNGTVMAVAFRLIQIELAAKRMLEFAFQARNAYAADSLYEAQTALRAINHAIVSCDSHIEHATIRIDDEITEVES